MVRETERAVYGFVRRRLGGDTHAVEDVAQETYLRAFRARDRIDPSRPVLPWLCTIADNVMRDRARRVARRPEDLDGESRFRDRACAEDTQPECRFELAEMRRRMNEALSRLPERQRRVLVASAIGGSRYAELAEAEAMTDEALKSLIARARRSFRAGYEAAGSAVRVLLPLPALAPALRRTVAQRSGWLPPAIAVDPSLPLLVQLSVAAVVGTLGMAPAAASDAGGPPRPSRPPSIAMVDGGLPELTGAAEDRAVGGGDVAGASAATGDGPARPQPTRTDIVAVDEEVPDAAGGQPRRLRPRVWWEDDGRRSVVLQVAERAADAVCGVGAACGPPGPHD